MGLPDAVGRKQFSPTVALVSFGQSKHRSHGVLKVYAESIDYLRTIADFAVLSHYPVAEATTIKAEKSTQRSENFSEQQLPAQTPDPKQRTRRPPSFLSRIPPRISSLSQAAKPSNLWNPLNSSTRIFSSPAAQKTKEDRPQILSQTEQVNDFYHLQPPQHLHSGQQTPGSLQVEQSEPSAIPSYRTSAIQPPLKPHKPHKNRNRKGKEPVHQPSPLPMADSLPPPLTSLSKPHSPPTKDLESGTTHSNQSHSPAEIPWGPSHPCYPHPNPHVPLSSPLSTSTRIIRIRRDWMISGDLAPSFSNIYPEILEPWVSEQDFRILIKTVNEGLMKAFKPEGWRAWGDAVLGLATGWLWEDFGFAAVKGKVRSVEGFIEEWNADRSRRKEDEGEAEVKVISLQRTGYLSLDIQIPDPHVGVIDRTSERSAAGQSSHGGGGGGGEERG